MAANLDSGLDRRAALLEAWVDKRRQIAGLEAEASHLLALRMRLSQTDADEHPYHRDAIHRSMVAEYAAAGRASTSSMEYSFSDAAFLEKSHPGVRAAFRVGAISAAHVRAIIRAGDVVREAVTNNRADAEVIATFDDAAVVIAESETPARTAAHVRALAAALAGSTVVERHAKARSERTVEVRSVGDGLALLSVVLPEHLAEAIKDRLTQLARGIIAARGEHEPMLDPIDDGENPVHPEDIAADDPARDDHVIFGDGIFTLDPMADPQFDPEHNPHVVHIPADTRTIDQVRADLLADLLLSAEPSTAHGTCLSGVRGRIQVTVSATTLAGLDDRPAELDGHGPLHPDVARALAGCHKGWTRLFLDPTGLVVETDTYTPTEQMRRFLRARDQHCRFPGCRMPVHRCQIDHTHDHAKGGRTELHNLGHLCATHHVLKHPDIADDHRWTARQLPDGTIDWLSPLGNSYRDTPPRRVMFA